MSDTTANKPSAQMSESTRSEFKAELEKLRANSGAGPRDKAYRKFGIALVVIGLIIILVAYQQATTMSDSRDILEMLIVGGLGGVLAIVGTVVAAIMSIQRFMRFWLLRVIFEQRDMSRDSR